MRASFPSLVVTALMLSTTAAGCHSRTYDDFLAEEETLDQRRSARDAADWAREERAAALEDRAAVEAEYPEWAG